MSQSTSEVNRPGFDGVGETAKQGTEPLERRVANEPTNTSIRTACLAAAGAAVLTSMIMQIRGKQHEALFAGQWAPTLIAVALWYQIVKSQ